MNKDRKEVVRTPRYTHLRQGLRRALGANGNQETVRGDPSLLRFLVAMARQAILFHSGLPDVATPGVVGANGSERPAVSSDAARRCIERFGRNYRAVVLASAAIRTVIMPLCISFSFAYTAPQPKNLVPTIEDQPASLTIEQAVERALKHRPDLEALSYATQASKAGANAEISGYYPTVSLDSTIWQEQGQRDPANNTILSANQLIYSFNGPIQRYKRAKNYTEINALQEQELSNSIRLEVEKAFLQSWILQEQYATIAALAQSSRTTFEKAGHENKLNLLDKSVWLQNVEQYGISTSDIGQYRDSLYSAYKRLEFLMGQPLLLAEQHPIKGTSTRLTWTPFKNVHLKALPDYYADAINNRPEVKEAARKIDIERWNVRLAQGDRLPTFSAQAESGFQTFVYPDTGIRTTSTGYYSLAVSASWLVFDGVVKQYQERQAYANKVKEMLLKEQTVLNIKQEVQDKYFTLSKSLIRLQAQKLNYVRAHNDFVLRKQEFEIGQIAPTDFEIAKTTWEQAQLDWYSATVTVEVAKRELMYACGYPQELVF
jgi:outer membrane protein TolC